MAQIDELRAFITRRWEVGSLFSLADVYEFVPEFEALHPENAHPRDKLRQLLQRLRDERELEFVDSGTYRRLGTTNDWTLKPGDTIERVALHERYGGRKQGGIGPSNQSPNVFVFTSPSSGEQYGYIDAWREDGAFHYTGEGQRGDQQMKSGNKSILEHEADGRALRLFSGARGTVRYEGEFELDADEPWYTTDAPEIGSDQTRSVIVFRMRPKDTTPRSPTSKLDALPGDGAAHETPVEEQWTEKAYVNPAREPYEAERREQRLVRDYLTHLERQGHDVCRLMVVPPGEAKPIFCDMYDKTTGTLIEAKGTVQRSAIRMAIGQLADYRRFVDGGAAEVAILTPSQPRADLLALLASQNVSVIWQEGDGFDSIATAS